MIARCLLLYLSPKGRKWSGKASVFGVTYVAYALVTAARLPYSIAKSSLRPDNPSHDNPGWRPFTDEDGQVLLGTLDTIFMFGYAGAMPFMGAVADRTHQPRFLSLGLLLVGIFLVLIGLARMWDIHLYAYFAIVSFLGGCSQSIAYPCVIAVIAKWFGKSHIGFILGIWASCTPMGTIIGKFGATAALTEGWQLAFIAPGLVVIISAVLVVLLLVSDPYDVQLLRPGEARRLAQQSEEDGAPDMVQQAASRRAMETASEEVLPLRTILSIPSMVSYCSACFFSKLAYYAFLFWLPYYLDHALHYDKTKAGNMSTWFDWGGFTGGIIGGVLSDQLRLRGVVLLGFQTLAVPLLFLYMWLGQHDLLTDTTNQVVLFALGFTVTTPYSLITSVMSADLGRHPSLRGNSKAAATVTAILDGTGSFGAVLQGLVIGAISEAFGWNATFAMLMAFSAFSAACLIRPSVGELRERAANRSSSIASENGVSLACN
mmetsp:Transcript_96961/g.177326  ORF Transcript_96961/g.177326 Transcript_96961/m.177326 type:complete len:488 (+) Transcript_96961:57-1520(+)